MGRSSGPTEPRSASLAPSDGQPWGAKKDGGSNVGGRGEGAHARARTPDTALGPIRPGERAQRPAERLAALPLVEPAVDPQTQGQGFLFLVGGEPSGFSPNAAVTAYLKIPGDSLKGVMIPSSAVVRYQGKAWVYVQTGDKEFTRREIPLDHPGASGWFVSSGVTDKDRVVASGTQTILSEELNQSGFMGSDSVVSPK